MIDRASHRGRAPGAVIALVPSRGSGGGIEAYVGTVLQAIKGTPWDLHVLVLAANGGQPSTVRKSALGLKVARLIASRKLRSLSAVRILCFHPGLVPVAGLVAIALGSRASVATFFYGAEIWTAKARDRLLWRRYGGRLITISSFSAGALSELGNACVLPPGIDETAYHALRSLPIIRRQTSEPLHLLSVFRLGDFVDKGGEVIVEAVERLRGAGYSVDVTFAGTRPTQRGPMTRATVGRPWIQVVEGPSASELHALYEGSDLFVLATRTRSERPPTGEGFGIVLVEAALAGLATVAPAFGGSDDAFIENVTGLKPADQSVGALEQTLRWVIDRPEDRARLASNGRQWASAMFDPERHRTRIRAVLLEESDDVPGAVYLRLAPRSSSG